MLSIRRTRCLLLACCAFLILLLMGVSAASDASLRVSSSSATVTSTAFIVDVATLTDTHDSWHMAAADTSPNDPLVQAYSGDVDDEPALPISLDLPLHHPRFDTPAGVIPSLTVAPAARLLRPPRLA